MHVNLLPDDQFLGFLVTRHPGPLLDKWSPSSGLRWRTSVLETSSVAEALWRRLGSDSRPRDADFISTKLPRPGRHSDAGRERKLGGYEVCVPRWLESDPSLRQRASATLLVPTHGPSHEAARRTPFVEEGACLPCHQKAKKLVIREKVHVHVGCSPREDALDTKGQFARGESCQQRRGGYREPES